ncbi:hypothetical protein MKEN_00961500 [Mycena kentingensis (nom. inval.)]|nr:hypothetical protein MKEN_00961500 [Mycena kentingensis (nom. inval.)]
MIFLAASVSSPTSSVRSQSYATCYTATHHSGHLKPTGPTPSDEDSEEAGPSSTTMSRTSLVLLWWKDTWWNDEKPTELGTPGPYAHLRVETSHPVAIHACAAQTRKPLHDIQPRDEPKLGVLFPRNSSQKDSPDLRPTIAQLQVVGHDQILTPFDYFPRWMMNFIGLFPPFEAGKDREQLWKFVDGPVQEEPDPRRGPKH